MGSSMREAKVLVVPAGAVEMVELKKALLDPGTIVVWEMGGLLGSDVLDAERQAGLDGTAFELGEE